MVIRLFGLPAREHDIVGTFERKSVEHSDFVIDLLMFRILFRSPDVDEGHAAGNRIGKCLYIQVLVGRLAGKQAEKGESHEEEDFCLHIIIYREGVSQR